MAFTLNEWTGSLISIALFGTALAIAMGYSYSI